MTDTRAARQQGRAQTCLQLRVTCDAAAAAALACGNAECRKALAPSLLQCSKCKAEAYCCKACQVGDPACPADDDDDCLLVLIQ